MLSDSPLRITLLVSILIHVLFLGIPEGMLKFLSPEVEASRDFIAQIKIEEPPPIQKIEKPKPKPKPKEPEPEPEQKEVIEEPEPESEPEPLPEEEPVSEPVEVEKPQITPQPVEQVAVAKVDFDKIALQNYQRQVRSKIEQAKKYPIFARRNEIEGIVKVQFTILSDGRVEGIKILKSSNREILDIAACNTIRQAAPFPPLPKEIATAQLQMQIDIVFKLE